jgi:hypothetical protein
MNLKTKEDEANFVDMLLMEKGLIK